MQANPGQITVRAASPHGCPDTRAMRVTVRAGRAVRVAGDPDHPTDLGGAPTFYDCLVEVGAA